MLVNGRLPHQTQACRLWVRCAYYQHGGAFGFRDPITLGRMNHILSIGTIFVLGDSEKVLEQTKSLVLNPFFGHPEETRNILDVRLAETIKPKFGSILARKALI